MSIDTEKVAPAQPFKEGWSLLHDSAVVAVKSFRHDSTLGIEIAAKASNARTGTLLSLTPDAARELLNELTAALNTVEAL